MIEAPIDLVWEVMLDTDRYPEWNPFVVRIDRGADPLALGDPLVLHVRWHTGGGARSTERISKLEGPDQHGGRRALLEYEYHGPYSRAGLVRGRRRQELARIDGAVTSYTTTERLRGGLAWAAPIVKIRDGFDRHATALKARAESLFFAG